MITKESGMNYTNGVTNGNTSSNQALSLMVLSVPGTTQHLIFQNSQAVAELLQTHPIFKNLSLERCRQALVQNALVVKLQSNKELFKIGDKVNYVYFQMAGETKVGEKVIPPNSLIGNIFFDFDVMSSITVKGKGKLAVFLKLSKKLFESQTNFPPFAAGLLAELFKIINGETLEEAFSIQKSSKNLLASKKDSFDSDNSNDSPVSQVNKILEMSYEIIYNKKDLSVELKAKLAQLLANKFSELTLYDLVKLLFVTNHVPSLKGYFELFKEIWDSIQKNPKHKEKIEQVLTLYAFLDFGRITVLPDFFKEDKKKSLRGEDVDLSAEIPALRDLADDKDNKKGKISQFVNLIMNPTCFKFEPIIFQKLFYRYPEVRKPIFQEIIRVYTLSKPVEKKTIPEMNIWNYLASPGLPDSKPPQFIDLLERNPDLATIILDRIPERSSAEKFIDGLCSNPENKKIITNYLVVKLKQELQNAESEGTLLRDTGCNSLYLFSAFQNRLLDCLKPLIGEIVQNPLGLVRVDGERTSFDIPAIETRVSAFLDKIEMKLNEPGVISSELQGVYKAFYKGALALKTTKAESFGKMNPHMHIASFLFLTVLNPMIATPRRFGLRDAYSEEEQRNATALTKVIQNCVNDYQGDKDQWVNALVKDGFVSNQHQRILTIAVKLYNPN